MPRPPVRFDPTKESVGLTRGNKLEQVVWEEFAHRPDVLAQIAAAIRSGSPFIPQQEVAEEDEEDFPEGRVLYRLHRMRERNKGVIEKAKALAKKRTGRLACFACGFDFEKRYGPLGADYIEGHHTRPLSELGEEGKTKVGDIALVCSNCHCMIHRRRPWLKMNDLKGVLRSQEDPR